VSIEARERKKKNLNEKNRDSFFPPR